MEIYNLNPKEIAAMQKPDAGNCSAAMQQRGQRIS